MPVTEYAYDPDRFDCEILIERSGHTSFTAQVVAELVGCSYNTVRKRLSQGKYPRPAIFDACDKGFVGGGHLGVTSEAKCHLWSREQVIDMMIMGKPCKPIEHGTLSGHTLERKRRIPHCDPCRHAYNKARREKSLV